MSAGKLLVVLGCAAGAIGWLGWSNRAHAAADSPVQPFWAKVTRTGGGGPATEFIHAVRGDGAWARLSTGDVGGRAIATRTVELPNGFSATWFSPVQVVSSGYMSQEMLAAARRGRPGSDCTVVGQGAALLGTEVLFGMRTLKIRQEKGGMRTTVWAVPELGCFAVQKVSELGGTNSGGAMREMVSEIHRGEPDAAWFAVPAGYAEVTPSEARARVWAHVGKACNDCAGEAGRQRDAWYQQLRRAPESTLNNSGK